MREVNLTASDYHAIIDATLLTSFERRKLHDHVPSSWPHKNYCHCPLAQVGELEAAETRGHFIDLALEVHLGHVALDKDTPIHVRKD